MDQSFKERLTETVGDKNVSYDVPMSRHTTFHVGGPADIFITPRDMRSLVHAVELCRREGVEFIVIGNGSNLLVRDGGIPGVVIDLSTGFKGLSIEGCVVRAMAGERLSAVSRAAAEASLTGLEFAEGIPGTVGGAVYMNAGAYGGEMSGITGRVTCLAEDGSVRTMERSDHGFGYRHSVYEGSGIIILDAEFELAEGSVSEINARMADFRSRRREKQPIDKYSAGSTFKRPQSGYAAAMIDECGLKGLRVGGASVSEKHSGFVINDRGATASDILTLMEQVQDAVESRFGVRPEPEVRIVGIDKRI